MPSFSLSHLNVSGPVSSTILIFLIFCAFASLQTASVVVTRRQQDVLTRPITLADRVMIARQSPIPQEKFLVSPQEAYEYAKKIDAEVLVCSARDLIIGGQSKSSNHARDIFDKAKELFDKTGKPVVVIIMDVELVMEQSNYNKHDEILHELLDKVYDGRHDHHIITLFTTSIQDQRPINWIISSRTNRRDWQIPDEERTKEIVESYKGRMAWRKRQEEERLRKEELKRQEEQRRRELEEQERKRQEEIKKKAEEKRLAWEREKNQCPLFSEENKQLKNKIIEIEQELVDEKHKLTRQVKARKDSEEEVERLERRNARLDDKKSELEQEVFDYQAQYGLKTGIALGSIATLIGVVLVTKMRQIKDFFSWRGRTKKEIKTKDTTREVCYL